MVEAGETLAVKLDIVMQIALVAQRRGGGIQHDASPHHRYLGNDTISRCNRV